MRIAGANQRFRTFTPQARLSSFLVLFLCRGLCCSGLGLDVGRCSWCSAVPIDTGVATAAIAFCEEPTSPIVMVLAAVALVRLSFEKISAKKIRVRDNFLLRRR